MTIITYKYKWRNKEQNKFPGYTEDFSQKFPSIRNVKKKLQHEVVTFYTAALFQDSLRTR